MSRQRGRIVRCGNEVDGVRCARVAEFVGFGGNEPDYKCEGCTQGGKPYVPRVGRPGQQKQAK